MGRGCRGGKLLLRMPIHRGVTCDGRGLLDSPMPTLSLCMSLLRVVLCACCRPAPSTRESPHPTPCPGRLFRGTLQAVHVVASPAACTPMPHRSPRPRCRRPRCRRPRRHLLPRYRTQRMLPRVASAALPLAAGARHLPTTQAAAFRALPRTRPR